MAKSGWPKRDWPKSVSSQSRRGFTRHPESPNVHISVSRPSKTPPKFKERTAKRGKNNENGGGRGEQKERNFGRSSGGGVRERESGRRWFGGSGGRGPGDFGRGGFGEAPESWTNTHQHTTPHTTHENRRFGPDWPESNWPKSTIGPNRPLVQVDHWPESIWPKSSILNHLGTKEPPGLLSLKWRSTLDAALCCHPPRAMPGSISSGSSALGRTPLQRAYQDGGSKPIVPTNDLAHAAAALPKWSAWVPLICTTIAKATPWWRANTIGRQSPVG